MKLALLLTCAFCDIIREPDIFCHRKLKAYDPDLDFESVMTGHNSFLKREANACLIGQRNLIVVNINRLAKLCHTKYGRQYGPVKLAAFTKLNKAAISANGDNREKAMIAFDRLQAIRSECPEPKKEPTKPKHNPKRPVTPTKERIRKSIYGEIAPKPTLQNVLVQ